MRKKRKILKTTHPIETKIRAFRLVGRPEKVEEMFPVARHVFPELDVAGGKLETLFFQSRIGTQCLFYERGSNPTWQLGIVGENGFKVKEQGKEIPEELKGNIKEKIQKLLRSSWV